MTPSARGVTASTPGRLSRWLAAALLPLFACAAVSCNEAPAVPDDGGPVEPRVCSDNWSTVYAPEQSWNSLPPRVLGWRAGQLYTVVSEQFDVRLVSFPDVGGERRTLHGGLLNHGPWFEGTEVLFLGFGEPVDRPDGTRIASPLLQAVPLTGGSSRVLSTIEDTWPVSTFIMAWAIDSENVYWVVHELPGPRVSVRAAARAGGRPRVLAVLEPGEDETSLLDGIESVGDHLLIYPKGFGFDVPVFRVPKAGGPGERLPTAWHSASLVGVSTDGTVLLQRQTKVGNGEPRSEEFELGRLRPGADAVEPFWPGHPPTAYAISAWDDGAGGFYVHAWEWGPHDALHATMWSLDAEGRGQRLGCDPLVRSIISVAAVGPDGIYAIVTPANTASYWSVVKIAR